MVVVVAVEVVLVVVVVVDDVVVVVDDVEATVVVVGASSVVVGATLFSSVLGVVFVSPPMQPQIRTNTITPNNSLSTVAYFTNKDINKFLPFLYIQMFSISFYEGEEKVEIKKGP